MNKLQLNHEETPANLLEINSELESLLSNEELDDKRLLELVNKRDGIIQQHLSSLSEQSKHSFASAELEANKRLSKVARKFFSASLKSLSGLVRGKKAAAKYK